jgi:hypothetical protein
VFLIIYKVVIISVGLGGILLKAAINITLVVNSREPEIDYTTDGSYIERPAIETARATCIIIGCIVRQMMLGAHSNCLLEGCTLMMGHDKEKVLL